MGTLLPTIFIPQSELLSTCWVSWIASLSLSICCADLSPYADEAGSDKCGLLTQENEASSDFEDTVLVLGHHHTLQPLLNEQGGFFL